LQPFFTKPTRASRRLDGKWQNTEQRQLSIKHEKRRKQKTKLFTETLPLQRELIGYELSPYSHTEQTQFNFSFGAKKNNFFKRGRDFCVALAPGARPLGK
jgi:hypothetical protein